MANNIPSFSSEFCHDNLNPEERKALSSLKNNDRIIIRPVDKGNSFCILDREHYIRLIENALELNKNYNFGEIRTYLKINQNLDYKVMEDLKNFCNKYIHILSDSNIDFLTKFQWKTANFYGLPKVHKSKTILNAIENQKSYIIKVDTTDDLKIRPIVGGWASPTSRLSEMIDDILKKLVKRVNSYIKDEKTFLEKIPWDIMNQHKGYVLTLDIESMFTNITLSMLLEAVAYWYELFPEDVDTKFSWPFLRDAITFVMTNNVFSFNGNFFLQKKGMAMGTDMACNGGDLTVGYYEVKLIANLHAQEGPDYANYIDKNLMRYRDDVFIYLPDYLGQPAKILNYLNNMHPNLNFTMNQSRNKIEFLSILIYKSGNNWSTDIHYKLTNSHSYLEYNSCHPHSTKAAIPYNLANRIKERVTDPQQLQYRLCELKTLLSNRGYPNNLIENAILRINSENDNSNTLQVAQKKFIISMCFNPRNPHVKAKIMSILSILQCDSRMKSIMDKFKITWAYRQSHNLKSVLCPSAFKCSENSIIGKVSKCNKSRCELCKIILPCSKITFENGMIFIIKSFMNCESTFVIYAMICKNCKQFYIGETESLRPRMNNTKKDIKHEHYRKLFAYKHIYSCKKGFNFLPIFECKNNDIIYRKNMELYFIDKLKPSLNR